MIQTVQDIFTEGLYTLEQASRLAQVSPQLLRNWLYGSSSRDPALIRKIPDDVVGLVGFIDLIQTLAIRDIRKQGKLSLQKVRATIQAAHERGIEYPFARRHQTYLFSDDVVIRIPPPPDERLIQVTGKYKNQQLLHAIAEPYLEELSFDPMGLAKEYSPLSDGDCKIILNPKVQYGAPVVLPSGYTVAALVNAFQGEGSFSEAAAAFEICDAEVRLAVRYDNFLSGTAA